MKYIHIETKIPGPKSKKLLKERDRAVAPAITTQLPIEIVKADGALIFDADGNCLIDLAAGIGSLNVGHSHPDIVQVVKEQTDSFINPVFSVAMFDSYVKLSAKLNELVPGSFSKKTAFFNSGAEAVENAIKIARRYTNRPAIISFEGAFHGRTFMTMSLTSKVKSFKKGFGPMATDVYRLPYPNKYHDNQSEDEIFRSFHKLFQTTVDPSDVAAIIMEPVQGDGGCVVPSSEFVKKVRQICSEYGIVFIADEVQTGLGRTGKLFAMENFGVAADLTVTGKSLGSGTPLSGVTGKAEIMNSPKQRELGSTLGGHALGCSIGLKTLEIIEENNLIDRANAIGKAIYSRLSFESNYIGDIRGMGAMIGIEFVKDKKTKTPYPELVKRIVRECHANGVVVITAGLNGNVIRLLPPLVISDDQLEEALNVLVRVIKQVENDI